jgi:predicted nucleic acid-binding protein
LGQKAFTSALTLWQLHILLKRESRNYSEEILIEKISGLKNLTIVPLTLRDFEDAVTFQKELGLDLEHNLHYAVAHRLGAACIYSNDTDFDNVYIERKFNW